MAGRSVSTLLVTVVMMAALVTGRPQQCLLDDYAKAMLAQYYPAAVAAEPVAIETEPVAAVAEPVASAAEPVATVAEPKPFDDEPSTAPRSGRSNDRDKAGRNTIAAGIDPVQFVTSPVGHYYGYMEHAATARSTACGRDAEIAKSGGNATTAAAVAPASVPGIEKLTAYYEQLKSQQEVLARQQFQQQIFEQQQRRQQQFALVQQQAQQQYFQQQQHALLMLEQLRKNPVFINQLAAFVNQKHPDAAVNTGTAAEALASYVPPKVAAAKAKAAEASAVPGERSSESDQIIANHEETDKNSSDEGCVAKHVETRKAEDRSASSEDDQTAFDDEQSPPILEKVYSMASE